MQTIHDQLIKARAEISSYYCPICDNKGYTYEDNTITICNCYNGFPALMVVPNLPDNKLYRTFTSTDNKRP